MRSRAGWAERQLWLGEAYRRAGGAAGDYAQAVRWFARAAENGDNDARVLLGVHAFLGVGMKRNDAMAAALFRRAAKAGNPCALQNLSLCYEHGMGVRRNEARALQLSRSALEKGLASACGGAMGAEARAWATKMAAERGLPAPVLPALWPQCRWRPLNCGA